MSARFNLRLYVTGKGLNSSQAVTNLRALCRYHLSERHEIEVMDVFHEPPRALADGVFLTPLLVKLSPSPVWIIVRNLSQPKAALAALGLPN